MKPKVLVTCPLPGGVLDRLQPHAEVEVYTSSEPLSKSRFIEKLQDKAAVISLLVDPLDEEVLSQAPELKLIANYAVGYDNIDVKAATERGIMVCNTPDVLTEATADLAWALLLGAARRIPSGDQYMREGRFSGWEPSLMLGSQVSGKTLGIVGMGRIGQATAARATGFGMKVLYTSSRTLAPSEESALNAKRVPLGELLQQADFVSLHAPYDAQNHHMIGEQALLQMKPTSYLINTARGALVDEAALVQALREGWIAGAGLDVFEKEPAMAEGLRELDNVVLAPHVGSATIEARTAMGRLCVDNVLAGLNGQRPPTLLHANGRGR
ncbi:2-hydroxyacid dehydrogenase [Marinicrinis sediminis]|uniref:2-hydroxyacid dehydrogenase n=1 Tax=Marinicrinis sediminis TaxID=1652465 RepID=A0ABW5R9I9_9BACL